jgi:hypothetical protein
MDTPGGDIDECAALGCLSHITGNQSDFAIEEGSGGVALQGRTSSYLALVRKEWKRKNRGFSIF